MASFLISHIIKTSPMRVRSTARNYQNRLTYLGYFHWPLMIRKLSPRRLVQVVGALIDWKFHILRPRSRPFAFRLEPCATCNLRCPLCATTYRKFTARDTKVMTMATFRGIHEQIQEYAAKMTFYLEGEPLLNPHLFEMIELATRDNNVFTSFSTNFTQMNERLLAPMFASRLDWISVSIDGFHQTTYEKYRVGGDVKRVLNGISMTHATQASPWISLPLHDCQYDHIFSCFPQRAGLAPEIL